METKILLDQAGGGSGGTCYREKASKARGAAWLDGIGAVSEHRTEPVLPSTSGNCSLTIRKARGFGLSVAAFNVMESRAASDDDPPGELSNHRSRCGGAQTGRSPSIVTRCMTRRWPW